MNPLVLFSDAPLLSMSFLFRRLRGQLKIAVAADAIIQVATMPMPAFFSS